VKNNQTYELTQDTKINYNGKDKQWFAQEIKWAKTPIQRQVGMFLILQWFIYNRNFGVVKHKGMVYNLNLDYDACEMLHLLEEEGFLKIVRGNEIKCAQSKEVIILDPNYKQWGQIPFHHLWVNLIDNYLTQLSVEEVTEYNTTHLPKES
jgi:hypothetical protein